MPNKNTQTSKSTEGLLVDIGPTYRGIGNEQETPEEFKARMCAALNEELTFEELEEALPIEYRQYLIRDPEIQKKREATSQKVREIKVAFQTGALGEKTSEPYPINRSSSVIRAYLRRNKEADLAEEYAEVMNASQERQEALAKNPIFAENNVSMAAYDRGTMLAKLCNLKDFQQLTVTGIMNMTSAEKLEHMEELLFLNSIAMNIEQVLHQEEKVRVHSLIKFSAPARELCNHVLDLQEVTGTVVLMSNIMTNPCYKYLDLERLFREQKLTGVLQNAMNLIANNGGAISRLGQDMVGGAIKIQKENVIRIEEQLKTSGINLEEAVWTRPDGTKMDINGVDDIEYITEGNAVIVTEGIKKLTVHGGRDQEIQIRPYVPLDDCVPRLYKELKKLGFDPEQTMFATKDQDVIDLDKEEDAADYAAGKVIYAFQGEKQIAIQGLDRKGNLKWEYTEAHYDSECQRAQTEIENARATAQREDATSRQNIAEAENSIANAEREVTTGKARNLAAVRRSIRKGESIFVKGSPQFREIKAALKRYAEMPDVDRNSRESVEEIKTLLEGIDQNVRTYLGNKQGEGTTRLERKRVRAVRQVQNFVGQQLEQLRITLRSMNAKSGEEQLIRERERKIKEREAKVKELFKKKENSPISGFQVPEQVQKYYAEKWMTKKRFLEKVEEIANEEYLETSPIMINIDGELLNIPKRYGSLTDSTNWKTTEILNGELKEVATELLIDVVLKTMIRNDQYAHSEDPTVGIINQLADKLELKELKKILSDTPTMRVMLQNLTGQSVADLVLKQTDSKQKEKILKIMNEIPVSARNMLKEMPEDPRKQELLSKLKDQKPQKVAGLN